MTPLTNVRTLQDWLYKPSLEEQVCANPFHSVVTQIYAGSAPGIMNPGLEADSVYVKVAQLLKAELVLPSGDVIYVKEGTNLIPLNEATSLLSYYMHTDSKQALGAAAILENNFQGYFPVTTNKVWRDGITLDYGNGQEVHVDLKTLTEVEKLPGLPEFGKHTVNNETFGPLEKYFGLINEAVGESYFFEKTLMYPFNQRIREKSHVLVGGGGNGKSLFMTMMQRLYGNKAYTDAPQPSMSGHAKQVVSYGFIGKRVVTFNDVGDPSSEFLEWLKRMITGNLEVKTPSGAWLSVPCNTNFLLESNHTPQILDIAAHKRRYVVREFPHDFLLAEHMTSDELDIIGERGNITAGDIVSYLLVCKDSIDNWTNFSVRLPQPDVTNVTNDGSADF